MAASLPEVHPSRLDKARPRLCEGEELSRFDGDLTASTDAPLSVAELVTILSGDFVATDHQRQQAIACFLSASDGWKDAIKSLGGAFAADAVATKLKDEKAE
jgi:hypothetical protein